VVKIFTFSVFDGYVEKEFKKGNPCKGSVLKGFPNELSGKDCCCWIK
jgi:hypothetical protein